MTAEISELKKDIEDYRRKMVELWKDRQRIDSEVLKIAEYLDSLITRYQKL